MEPMAKLPAPPDAEPQRSRLREIWKAMMLSPTLEVCEALLRGESVPLERLDPEWVARFARRER